MLTPRKRLGQNFLRDPNTIRKIVSQVPRDALRVVEIGPGTGALTGLLLEQHPSMVALEVDERAVDLLRETYPALDVRLMDVLKVSWPDLAEELGGPLHVIGNLPYYITTPILFSMLESDGAVAEAVVMMQREVARRIVAQPGSKTYGILSVLVQKQSRPELLFDVSPNVFYPRPDVVSSVMRLDIAAAPEVDAPMPLLRRVVRTAFNQRRKTLRNSLSSVSKDLPDAYVSLRADALTPDNYVELTRYLADKLS